MQRDHLGQQLALLVQQPLLLFLGVVPSLGLEFGELRVFLEEQRVDPGQVRPDLKVAQVARAKPVERLSAGSSPRRPQHVELVIARMRADHGIGERHEEIVEQIAGVVVLQAVDRAARQRQMACRSRR